MALIPCDVTVLTMADHTKCSQSACSWFANRKDEREVQLVPVWLKSTECPWFPIMFQKNE